MFAVKVFLSCGFYVPSLDALIYLFHSVTHSHILIIMTSVITSPINFFIVHNSLLMLKYNDIIFPSKFYQILTSLLVWPMYKKLLAAISWYQKCGLYMSIYSTCISRHAVYIQNRFTYRNMWVCSRLTMPVAQSEYWNPSCFKQSQWLSCYWLVAKFVLT